MPDQPLNPLQANDASGAFQLDPSLLTTAGTQLNVQDLSKYFGVTPSSSAALASSSVPSFSSLANARSEYASDLQNPDARRLLMASTDAEVGNQGIPAKVAYMETVMNRASAENRSLVSVLLDQHYYPSSTINKLGATFNKATTDHYNSVIDTVLNGSNISNLATGNESGRVRSGGAPITFNPGTGERFVAENWTHNWRRNALASLSNANPPAPAPTQQAPMTIAQAQQIATNR